MKHSDVQRNNDVDEYVTPYELALAAVNLLKPHLTDSPRLLDAGANTGVWGKAAREVFPNAYILGVELMEMPCPEWYDTWYPNTNFLEWELPSFWMFDGGIGNPPYSDRLTGKRRTIVDSFILHSLRFIRFGGPLVQLLRTNFGHGVHRNSTGLLSTNGPKEEYRCLPRPSFYGEDVRIQQNSTNTHDYSVFKFISGKHYPHILSYPLFWRERDRRASISINPQGD